MGKYLHEFDTVSAFTQAYTGETYEEPWVSLTNETSAVTFNRSPYFGKGLVFDMAQSASAAWYYSLGDDTNFKLIYDDSEAIVLAEPNRSEMPNTYEIDSNAYEDWVDEAGENRTLPITIVNAKAIDSALTDTIDLTLSVDHYIIGGDDRLAYVGTLANGRKIWVIVFDDFYPGGGQGKSMMLYMTSRY